MNIKFIGIDRTLNHCFPQAISGGDKDHIRKAGLGIHGKHDTAGPNITAHHALYAGRQGNLAVVEALVDPIGDGAIIKEGGENRFHGGKDIFLALDVQVGFLLSGKRGIGQVLGSG